MPFLQLVTDVTSGCDRGRKPALSQVAMVEAGFLNGHLAMSVRDRGDTCAGPIRDFNFSRLQALDANEIHTGDGAKHCLVHCVRLRLVNCC